MTRKKAPLDERLYLTPPQVSELMSVDNHAVYRWMAQETDPLPAYYPPGNQRNKVIKRKELEEWAERNFQPA